MSIYAMEDVWTFHSATINVGATQLVVLPTTPVVFARVSL